MLIIVYALLIVRVGRCTDDRIFETKIFGVGETVTLTCPRQTNIDTAYLFWMRLHSGNLPEVLGATYSLDSKYVNKISRFTTKQEPGTFVLEIKEADLGDTGLYFCFITDYLELKFLTGTFLRIKGPDPDITLVTSVFRSDPVHPGASVTLQCSVLTDHRMCSGEHNVFWFKDGLNEFNPSFVYTQIDNSTECEKALGAHGSQTCYYTFSNVTSSDAGTYYCAVAACGKIIIGDGMKIEIQDIGIWLPIIIFIPPCAVLAVNLTIMASVVCKKKRRKCSNAPFCLRRNSDNQKRVQRCEDHRLYSVGVFTVMESGSENDNTAVKAFGLD